MRLNTVWTRTPWLALLVALTTAEPLLWPLPSVTSVGHGEKAVFTNVSFHVNQTTNLIDKACMRYTRILNAHQQTMTAVHGPRRLTVRLDISEVDAPLSPGQTDESYRIVCDIADECVISSPNQWGTVKGLETLSQLIESTSGGFLLPAPPIRIEDAPRFKWRGLMIDTGRNFLTTTTIKMTLDAMAYTKLNVRVGARVRSKKNTIRNTR